MKTNQRISELDALRGIGALLVVLCHYTYRYYEYAGSPVPAFNFRYGRLGVKLLFFNQRFCKLTSRKTAYKTVVNYPESDFREKVIYRPV